MTMACLSGKGHGKKSTGSQQGTHQRLIPTDHRPNTELKLEREPTPTLGWNLVRADTLQAALCPP